MSANIVITTIGTRGDVQPYIALAGRLRTAGFRVRIVAPDNFADWIGAHGIEFAPAGWDIETFLRSDEGKEIVLDGFWRRVVSFRALRQLGQKVFSESYRKIWAGVVDADADLIICHPKTAFATDFAEKLQVPAVSTAFQPISETAEFPMLSFRGGRWGHFSTG